MCYKVKRALKKKKGKKRYRKPFFNALADNFLSNQSLLAGVLTWTMDFLIIVANG